MNRQNYRAYVEYRLKKAEETHNAAVLLFENSNYNSSVNRLYYACFYAVGALLVALEIEAKSHAGTKTQFFLHFIKTKKIDSEYGKLYSDLFDWRQKGDYGDFFDFEKNDVQPLLEPTLEFLEIIKETIDSHS